ncbi:NADPH-dependent ferric siderophore reductase, contains FAD-binding and SIP domains [Gordonia malaquae]|uniref:Putative siderophore-interacting protein n=1 Tax=Gordonia malaquae NBRC 108250 TaxID=1223542 RepID=M3VC42_GORML|nr:siderophore-interacting protein [Gordonia malaquae]GAC81358.1 putative siderophore-interacting protein [Gordonia malaquae NBRC 108250]SEC07705.1 NADPH-dependent ferric siderophore reductase, contains FAD-binding and SIP domains [Gordonia malaquae]
MSADTTSPFVLARADVDVVEPVSPNFVRITFTGADVDQMATPGNTFDQRMKIIFPPASGVLPDLAGGDDWYQQWLDVPEDQRGSMRTYSIRDVVVDDNGTTKLVVDFVLHLEPGLTGPAATWASRAQRGDTVLLMGPRRGRTDGGGIEYAPGGAESVLLAGDETAAPAIARILEDAPSDLRGDAFIEVPTEADILPFAAPSGVAVHWLPRDGAVHGERLRPAVLEHLDASTAGSTADSVDAPDEESLVWETPDFSGLGEEIADVAEPSDRYFWIAGESKVVTGIRRHLVKELGVHRSQVAFMGYWRHGVAMKG